MICCDAEVRILPVELGVSDDARSLVAVDREEGPIVVIDIEDLSGFTCLNFECLIRGGKAGLWGEAKLGEREHRTSVGLVVVVPGPIARAESERLVHVERIGWGLTYRALAAVVRGDCLDVATLWAAAYDDWLT